MTVLSVRIIPCLLLRGQSLVKTIKYKKFTYIGDPINTCRIFNELEVDELCFLDITASKERHEPNYGLLKEIANECFMPLSYGGGIKDIQMAERIFALGFEKIVLNTFAHQNPDLISALSKRFGNQSIICAIDVKKSFFGRYYCYACSGTTRYRLHPVEGAKLFENKGAGEILLTSIDREGTWEGFDVDLVRQVSDTVSIPVIANGGAGDISDIKAVVKKGHASAVGLGSMVVFQKKGMGVLINFPEENELRRELGKP